MMTWNGRITASMLDKEDKLSTALKFTTGSAEALRFGRNDIGLNFTSADETANVRLRFTLEDCKQLIWELIQVL